MKRRGILAFIIYLVGRIFALPSTLAFISNLRSVKE